MTGDIFPKTSERKRPGTVTSEQSRCRLRLGPGDVVRKNTKQKRGARTAGTSLRRQLAIRFLVNALEILSETPD